MALLQQAGFGKKYAKYAAVAVLALVVWAVYTATGRQTAAVRPQSVVSELPPVRVGSGGVQTAYWTQEAVQAGDSLADVLARLEVDGTDIAQIMAKHGADADMRHLRANQFVNVHIDAAGRADEVQFFTDEELERNLVALVKQNGTWRLSTSVADMKTLPTLRSVVVKTSARGSMAQAEIPVEIRESLSEIFADTFSLSELSEGDVVRLLYNSLYFHGQPMGVEDILAAEVVKGGKTYRAFYYRSGKKGSESGNYYDENGKILQQKTGFNVEPVVYTRISSPFGYRVHPVLGTLHMHTGIDYAAPTGTPVKASADGVITFKGWKGGYGNAVMIRHANGVETLYGHLSAFSPAQGNVRGGEIIGFVGTTGRSTGPHLHYEARVNGQPVNPTTVALPTPKLTQADKAAFGRQQREAEKMLASVRGVPVTVSQLD